MSKESDILRLLRQGYPHRTICQMVHTSDRKIRELNAIKKDNNLSDDQIANMSEEEINAIFVKKKEVKLTQRRPNCEYIHKEMLKRNMTLTLLWEEYVNECISINEKYLKYTQFCNVYKEYVESNKLTMHIDRKPGEKCEVDWAGDTIPLYDRTRKQIIGKLYVFVGSLPFSMKIFAKASNDMKIENWISHHVSMYSYFGGVPIMTVCDNCKTAVISHKKYEELVYNSSYVEMADYYRTVIIAARVRAPKDKPTAEGAVGFVERQVLAALRDERFTSVQEANIAIFKKVDELNQKDFQKREYSRNYVFENEEKSFLQPLPDSSYEYGRWLKAKVSYNYHIVVEKNYYSVPYTYLTKQVDVRISGNLVEIFYNGERIASHKRILEGIGKYTTLESHMPDNHKEYGKWNSTRIKNWAESVGPNTYKVICHILESVRIEQQVYHRCITILKLKDIYSERMLEAASEKILNDHITPIHRNFKMIIQHIQVENETAVELDEEAYGFIRGKDYYGGLF